MRDVTPTDHNYAAIRLVAKRFAELQGLRYVLAGSIFAISGSAFLLAGAPHGFTGLFVTVVAAMTVIFTGMWLLDRYYIWKFGRVVQPEREKDLWRVAAIAVGTTLANQAFGVGPFTAGFIIAGGFALYIAIRDCPLRSYHVLSSVAAVVALTLTFRTSPAERHLAEAWALAICGTAYIPIGLLDHRLLRSVMRRGDVADPELENTKSGLKSCATEEPQ